MLHIFFWAAENVVMSDLSNQTYSILKFGKLEQKKLLGLWGPEANKAILWMVFAMMMLCCLNLPAF